MISVFYEHPTGFRFNLSESEHQQIEDAIYKNPVFWIKISWLAIAKGEYSVEINSNPHEIKSHINPEKRIWVDMCNWILDENSKTHQTLKENGFHISKTPHPKKRFKYIFIVTISWN